MPPTIRDIARLAGVDASTVSRVLSGKGQTARIADQTIARIRAIADEHGYRPNLVARSLRTSKAHTLGLLVTDLSNPFFATVAAACEAEASAAGYATIVATSGENSDRESEYLSVLRSRPVDGLIMTPADTQPHETMTLLIDEGFPLVFMDRRVPGISCDSVVVDNRAGARRIISTLAALGVRTVAVAGGPIDTWTGSERMKGFLEGIAREHLSLIDDYIATGPYGVDTGRRAMEGFMKTGTVPEAVVAANNHILLGVLEVLMKIGKPTAHVAVAAFDGVPFAGILGRPVVIAEQPRHEIGRQAARMLIDRIEGGWKGQPREIVLPVSIRVPGPESSYPGPEL
jgi:LacI family transcriptional regulator